MEQQILFGQEIWPQIIQEIELQKVKRRSQYMPNQCLLIGLNLWPFK